MRSMLGFITILAFAAVLAVAVGCSSDDKIQNVAGEYDLSQVLTSADSCALGSSIAVPISITQEGRHGVLIAGVVPGPDVCGAVSQGTVGSNRVIPASGETIFPDYWSAGCDLIQTDDWSLGINSSGEVSGSWSVSYRDDPPNCSGAGVFFPCTNDYAVTGLECVGCADVCFAGPAGSTLRPGSAWMKR